MKPIQKRYEMSRRTVRQLLDLDNQGVVIANNSVLQRREIASPQWKSDILRSIALGRTINVIHIAKQPRVDELGNVINGPDGIEYVYIIIDGLQRFTTFKDFDNNNAKLPKEIVVKVLNDDDVEVTRMLTREQSRTKQLLITDGLEELMNATIFDQVVDVCIYEGLSNVEIQNLFVLLNSGNAIKDQERRNAFPSILAEKIRQIARGNDIRDDEGKVMRIEGSHNIFAGQSTRNKYKAHETLNFNNERYFYDELVAKMVCLEKNLNIDDVNSSNLDTLYRSTANLPAPVFATEYDAVFNKINSVLDTMYSIIMNSGATNSFFQQKGNDFLIFYRVISKLIDHEIPIQEEKEFLNNYDREYRNIVFYVSENGRSLRRRDTKGRDLVNRVFEIITNITSLNTLKQEIWLRQDRRCAFTGQFIDINSATVTQIIPTLNDKNIHLNLTVDWNLVVVENELNLRRKNMPWYIWLAQNNFSGLNGDKLPPISEEYMRQYLSQIAGNDFFEPIVETAINNIE